MVDNVFERMRRASQGKAKDESVQFTTTVLRGSDIVPEGNRVGGGGGRTQYNPNLPQGSVQSEELSKLGRATIQERQELASQVRQQLSDRNLSLQERTRIKKDYQQRLLQTEIARQRGEAQIRTGKSFEELQKKPEVVRQDTFKMMVEQARREQPPQKESFGQKFLSSLQPKPNYQTTKSYKELYGEGDFPSIVRKGAEDVGLLVQKKVSTPTTKLITGKEITPEQEKVLGKMTGETLLFGSLLPTTSTRATVTTGESKYVYDYTTGRYVLKSELKEYLANKLLRQFDQAYNRGGQGEVAKELNNLVRRSGGKTKGIENLLTQLRNKGYIQGFVVNQETGQFSILGTQTTTKPITITINVPKTGNLQYVGVISSGQTPANILGMKGQSKQTVQPRNFDILGDVGTTQRTGQGITTSTLSISGQKTKQQQTTKQTQDFFQEQATTQTTKQGQTTGQTIRLLQIQKNLLKQKTGQRQKIKQTTKQQQTTKGIIPIPTTNFRKIINKIKEGEESYDIFARVKGIDVLVGKEKNKEQAFKKLKSILGGTLRASGFVTTKGGTKIKPVSFGGDFRPSKKDPFRVVEKRSKRLSTRSEVSEINFFKKSSKKKKRTKSVSWL